MPAQYTVGQLLPNGATVTFDSFVTNSDTSTTEIMDATYPSGGIDRTIITIPGVGTPGANAGTLQQRAKDALVNNATYLAIGAPTQAQAITQVAALTRQMDAVIRVLLNQYDTTVGT